MTTQNQKVNWSQILIDAVNKPGTIAACYSLFHSYSIGNSLWAYCQAIGRGIPFGPISTFKGWQKAKRFVKRGEKAISLCMPVTIKDKESGDESKCKTIFILKNNWFLLSQTEGDDYESRLPAMAWDKTLALKELGVTEIPFAHANGNCQGFARGDSIAISPLAQLPHKSTFHELAHVVLGHTKENEMSDSELTPRDIREVEAESVALILCETLGLDGPEYSRGYIQGWFKGNEIPDKSARKILAAADKILKAGQVKTQTEKE